MRGWFRTDRRITKGTMDLRAVALTAYEIASAMALLHKHDIVHGVSAPAWLYHLLNAREDGKDAADHS